VRSLIHFVAVVLFVAGCKSADKNPPPSPHAGHHAHHSARGPNATSEEIANSPEFKAFEEARQHTFIIMDKKGHFGYHVSQFRSGHQHQVIVRSEIKMKKLSNGKVKDTAAELSATPANGYWSFTSDKPRFFLREIFEGNPPPRRSYPASRYNGLIGIGQKVADETTTFEVKAILFHSPMIADEPRIPDATHIIFGSYDKPKKNFALAHLIKAANNYEQLMQIEFENEITVANGNLLVLGIPDAQPLEEGKTYEATVEGVTGNQKFKVLDVVYQDARPAPGFSNP